MIGRDRKPIMVCVYVADFRYREGLEGILTIEDVKGVRTPVYKLKKKLVEVIYGFRITEIGPGRRSSSSPNGSPRNYSIRGAGKRPIASISSVIAWDS